MTPPVFVQVALDQQRGRALNPKVVRHSWENTLTDSEMRRGLPQYGRDGPSRRYSEMNLANLSAAGEAIRESIG